MDEKPHIEVFCNETMVEVEQVTFEEDEHGIFKIRVDIGPVVPILDTSK